jgi:alkanesulfonate monooxygenase SsuD/methylene tetrahydromethanopterin reductase-like flavin-dependent oxidoreductase (luciferase family)
VCPTTLVAVSDDLEQARTPAKLQLALYIGGMGARGKNFYTDYAVRLGYEEAALRIQDLYLDGKKAEAVAAVPDRLVDDLFLIGPEDRIRERLAVWKEAGRKRWVDTLLIGAAQPEALELLAKELL